MGRCRSSVCFSLTFISLWRCRFVVWERVERGRDDMLRGELDDVLSH